MQQQSITNCGKIPNMVSCPDITTNLTSWRDGLPKAMETSTPLVKVKPLWTESRVDGSHLPLGNGVTVTMKPKIFDDFPTVDCNDCECYHDNTCDGTPVGQERHCTAFKATRRTDIPLQIKSLQRKNLRHSRALCVLGAIVGILVIKEIVFFILSM